MAIDAFSQGINQMQVMMQQQQQLNSLATQRQVASSVVAQYGNSALQNSYTAQMYDQMYMPTQGAGFNSPMSYMMNMMRNMMAMMSGGSPYMGAPSFGGQNNGYQPQWNYYPSPNQFWTNGNNQGYQVNDGYNYQRGYQNGGTYSQNTQNTYGGYSRQMIDGGTRSMNSQNHSFGYADQSIIAGRGSLNNQTMSYGAGNQTVVGGRDARITQTAVNANGTQLAHGGHGSRTLQVAEGSSQVDQRIRSGNGTTNTQAGGTNQSIVAGRNSQNTMATGTGGTQVLHAGAGSDNFLRAGSNSYQEANVGANSTTRFRADGSENTRVANLNGNGQTVVFGGQGQNNTNVLRDGDGASNRTWTSNTAGQTNVYEGGGGNDGLTVRLNNRRDNSAFFVNMGTGDDRTTLEGIPANAREAMNFQGGEGNDTFTFRTGGTGNYTLMRDGKVYHQVGTGGATINVDGYENVQIFGADGRPVTVAPRR